MAVTYNTPAIILRREDWNGHDSRLTIYTQVRGKIEAVARGLRKAESKLAAHLEPLTTTEIFIVEGRKMPIVAGSSIIDRHQDLRLSVVRLTAAGLLLRLIDLMTPLESYDHRVYGLLSDGLRILEETEEVSEFEAVNVSRIFAWKLLVFAGYHHELRHCLVCRRRIGGRQIIFDVRRGGVMHPVCAGPSDAARQVDLPAIKGLAYMADAPIKDTLRLRARSNGLAEMIQLIEAMVEERFEVGAGSRFWTIIA